MTARGERGQAAVEAVGLLVVLLAAGVLALSAAARHAPRAASVAALQRAAAAPALTAATGGPALGAAADPALAGGAVAIARQLERAGIREDPPGSNRSRWILTFSDGNAEPWCADFVSWVLRAAGRPFSGGASGGWRIAAAAGVRDWFAARRRYTPALFARPAPGDVVYFRHGHVGLVVAASDSSIATIEGNAGDAVSAELYRYWRLDSDIDGFGRP